MFALNVNEYIGIEEIQRLFPHPFLRLMTELTGERLAIGAMRSRSKEPFSLPIGDQFCTRGRCSLNRRPSGKET
jgi:hypothetical protein